MNSNPKAHLDRKLARQRLIALCGAIAVIVGLVVEAVIDFCFFGNELPIEKWGIFSATAIVAAGVVIETWFGKDGDATSEALQRLAERDTEQAKARAEEANRGAEEARERAVLVERDMALQTRRFAKFIGPRLILDRAAFLRALDGAPHPLTAEILCSASGADTDQLGIQLFLLLMDAGWPVKGLPERIEPNDRRLFDGPIPSSLGRLSSGIRLWVPYNEPESVPHEAAQASALREAVQETLGETRAGRRESVPDGTLEVIIFPKA